MLRQPGHEQAPPPAGSLPAFADSETVVDGLAGLRPSGSGVPRCRWGLQGLLLLLLLLPPLLPRQLLQWLPLRPWLRPLWRLRRLRRPRRLRL